MLKIINDDAKVYDDCPKLWAYLSRVGAVPKNFRRYVVLEDNDGSGYERERATITIKDGVVSSSDPAFAPSADELLAFIADAPIVMHNASFDVGFLNAELLLSLIHI